MAFVTLVAWFPFVRWQPATLRNLLFGYAESFAAYRSTSLLREAVEIESTVFAGSSTASRKETSNDEKKRSSTIDVGLAVVVFDGKVLFGSRNGLWELPGGKRELPESIKKCVAREVEEEHGIRVTVGPLVGKIVVESRVALREELHSRHPQWQRVRYWYFVCTIKSGEPQTIVHDEIQWLSCSEILERETTLPPWAVEQFLEPLF